MCTDQRVHKTAITLLEMGFDVLLVGRKLPDSLPIDRPYKTKRMRLIFKTEVWFYMEYNIRLFLFLLFKKADVFDHQIGRQPIYLFEEDQKNNVYVLAENTVGFFKQISHLQNISAKITNKLGKILSNDEKEITQLEKLDLGGNSIDKLSNNIGNLKQLKELNVSSNQLLSNVMDKVEIKSFVEVIPSMKDIFISQVKKNNKNIISLIFISIFFCFEKI